MNSWLNKFCPGFMICPRKPWPFGNEYHSIPNSDKKKQHLAGRGEGSAKVGKRVGISDTVGEQGEDEDG
jgi:hypothetical protein